MGFFKDFKADLSQAVNELSDDAAKFAGIPFIYVTFGFGKVESPDYIIDNYNELIEIVR